MKTAWLRGKFRSSHPDTFFLGSDKTWEYRYSTEHYGAHNVAPNASPFKDSESVYDHWDGLFGIKPKNKR
jgi:hypothetical protein